MPKEKFINPLKTGPFAKGKMQGGGGLLSQLVVKWGCYFLREKKFCNRLNIL